MSLVNESIPGSTDTVVVGNVLKKPSVADIMINYSPVRRTSSVKLTLQLLVYIKESLATVMILDFTTIFILTF